MNNYRIRVGLGKSFHRIAEMSSEVEGGGVIPNYPRPKRAVTLCGRETGWDFYPGHSPVGDTYSNGKPLPSCATCERKAKAA